MEVVKLQEGTKLTVALTGRLDTNTAPQLEEVVKSIDDSVNELVYDFANLEYVSSAGLRVLLITQKLMANRGKFTIINVDESVKEVFEITGFDEILTVE